MATDDQIIEKASVDNGDENNPLMSSNSVFSPAATQVCHACGAENSAYVTNCTECGAEFPTYDMFSAAPAAPPRK